MYVMPNRSAPPTTPPEDPVGLVIRRRMRELGKAQADLAHAVSRSQGWVSQYLFRDGETTLKRMWVNDPDTIKRLAEVLDWAEGELLAKVGLGSAILPEHPLYDEVTLETPDLAPATRRIPEWDLLSAGPGGDGGSIVDYVDIPANWYGTFAAYRVEGDSMVPTVEPGSTVITQIQDHAEVGEIVVCYAPNEGMLVKELGGPIGNATLLISHNTPTYKPIVADSVKIIGVVVEVRRSLKKPRRKNGAFS